jgi:hypothetical protein
MTEQKIIYYENIHYKLNWKYKSLLKDEYEITNITDIVKKIDFCYNSTQYIMIFIEMLKDKVIRLLPNLNKVQIIIGIFDKNNILHRLIVESYNIICNILQNEFKEKNFYKSIFAIIKYNSNIVFMGEINFDGIT